MGCPHVGHPDWPLQQFSATGEVPHGARQRPWGLLTEDDEAIPRGRSGIRREWPKPRSESPGNSNDHQDLARAMGGCPTSGRQPSRSSAQRRPELELRRHNPTSAARPWLTNAQRRPEPELRRHRPRASPAGRSAASLNEGRSLNSGDTPNRGKLGSARGDVVAIRSSNRPKVGSHHRSTGHFTPNRAVSRRYGPWREDHRRFATSLTEPTVSPERVPGAGPDATSRLRSRRESGRRARSRGRGR